MNFFFGSLGVWHYLLAFSPAGQLTLDRNVKIDFETMGRHLLALEAAARRNGLRIRKVILNTRLKPQLFRTESGRILKRKGVYFALALKPAVDRAHDDHYHVDFEPLR